MNDAEKPAIRAANDNPWYCLATLHGEQPIDGLNLDLAEKNCRAWNRWLADLTEGERASYVPVFARRTNGRTIMLPERAGVPDFSRTCFDRPVCFNAFQFGPGANFGSSMFSENAYFERAVFSNPVDFSLATFAEMADFKSSSFMAMAFFKSTTFSGVAHFESATFAHATHFESAVFSEGADFYRATFENLSAFDSAIFSKSADFSGATFTGAIDFNSATFAREIHFVNSKLAAVTHFTNVRFENRVPDFRGATMHEATEWHGVVWPKPPKNKVEAQQQVYAYERLKQEMERLKKHEDEQNFFRRELRARRGLVRVFSGGWLLNVIYQWSSDYGNSISRPLIWLFGVFSAGIAIFTHAPVCAGQPMLPKLAARLGFANIFVFLPDKREITNTPEMLACLSDATAAVSAVQSLLGVVLLFLLGLALRNRFRMR